MGHPGEDTTVALRVTLIRLAAILVGADVPL